MNQFQISDSRFQKQGETAAETVVREVQAQIDDRRRKLQDNTHEVFLLELALRRRRDACARLDQELDALENVRAEARRIQSREIRIHQFRPIRILDFEEVRDQQSEVSAAA
jgi:hypothetical protein